MPESATSDYITKTEAAQVYRRSERSISRDITNALKFGDRRVLQHVELRLENGKRRPATELSIGEVVDLRDRGLNPTWLLETAWLKRNYGRRDEPRPPASEPLGGVTDEAPIAVQPLPEDVEQRVAVLAAQNDALRQSNADLRMQAERLEKELDRRAEERREENELQKQNNVLMQQVYTMLSSMQESAGQVTLLPAPRPATEARTYEPNNAEVKTAAGRKGTQPARKEATEQTARKRPVKRSPQSQPDAKVDPKPAPTTVSKYRPTLGRAVRFLFRK